MVNPKELRIGNFVSHYGEVKRVDGVNYLGLIRLEQILDVSENAIEPIPLTPEWLEWCGFEKKMFTYPGDPKTEAVEAFVKGRYVIRWIDIGDYASYKAEYFPYSQSQNSLPGNMHYVHQLQNNYYWWATGEELEITQPVS